MAGPSLNRSQLEDQVQELKANLALAKEHITWYARQQEGDNAKLVVQDLTLRKIKEALNAKENKSTDKRKLFADGKAHLWTSDEVIQNLRALGEARVLKEQQKVARKEARACSKATKAQLEEQWAAIKAAHIESIMIWEAECQKLKEQGVRAKHLPKKPVRPKKPTATEVDAEVGGDEDDDQDDEDGDE